MVYRWILENIPIGISYTKIHLEEICKDLKLKFGDNWSFTPKRVSDFLNRIYNIEVKQLKKGAKVPPIEYSFYKNIHPIGGTLDKKANIYTVKNLVSVNDLINKLEIDNRKKELTTTISSNLNYVISKKVNSKLFENDIELISNIF